MSAATFYTTLKSTLDGLGYRELPGLMEIEEVKESHTDMGYILQPTGSQEDQNITNKCLATNHEWRLEVVYKNIDASERVTKYDSFHTLKTTLYALSDMIVFTSEPTFTRLANFDFNSVGTLTFQFGRE